MSLRRRFVKGVLTIYKNVPQNAVGLLGRFSGNIPGATEHPKKNIPDFLDRMFQTKICGFFFFKVIFEISLKVYSEK